ncbi:ATP-dependent DNA helicase [Sandaracinobacter neustonicus]|uniref:ATP-dependent DNA helicase n=1 Tax=Sandaracinobacter neustonicus TaxID=1715348 RepID=A0A501XVZ2_9SPHN|nr:ATP-dependent DNA helicase [Sandaracinobacter neustonicus]TPE64629.1 ATP-dependent DNA helicase [Sandaracinobacter neustonicus]
MVAPSLYPALVASHAGVWRADAGGRVEAVSRAEAVRRLADTPHLLLNAPQVAARLGLPEVSGLDLLELWAFASPAMFLVPSARGLADALGLELPTREADEAAFLQTAAAALLDRLADRQWPHRAGAADSLYRLQRKGWLWAEPVSAAMGTSPAAASIFDALPEWQDAPPRLPPLVRRHSDEQLLAQLAQLAGSRREPREGQKAYTLAAAHAFQPRDSRDGPNLVVAEAGTGIGKTLGYLAPASLHAAETGEQVWLSTFTRALQRQLKAETRRSLPGMLAAGQIVVRKGRENYLCLLNLEDAMQGSFAGRQGVFAELVARWARFTADGDMVGGDLPGWLPGLFRRGAALPALTDRRGECIRSACPHYRRCFIERSVREGQKAGLVIANHALVMANAVRARAEGQGLTRLVFDEGHHLHSAADSAFAVVLSGGEAIELRRWLLGPDRPGRRSGRRRGLSARLMDVTSYDGEGGTALEEVLHLATELPGADWLSRIGAGEPEGPIETLIAAVRTHVLTRASDEERGFSLETGIASLAPGLPEAVDGAAACFSRMARAMLTLKARLSALAEERPEWLDQSGIARLSAAAEGLQLRLDLLGAWQRLLARVSGEPEADFVDWFALIRAEGREIDCGIWRHWLDPLKPLAGAVLAPAHGVLVTSATLGDPPEAAAGAAHLSVSPHIFRVASPFDYAAQARVFIVTDVERGNTASLAHAYHALIEAAGGGTLGLFTAIARLRAVHARLADRMARAGLPLLAQHVDAVDTGTLVDLFRADRRATLFGTDALRDGVDVPGESLRLIVFEGVPWSRPTILNAARRAAFGGSAYEEMAVRHRLAQAFGRLIRSAEDKGAFVLLGASTPSRLLSAFPPDVQVSRVPLADAAAAIRDFLNEGAPTGIVPSERQL